MRPCLRLLALALLPALSSCVFLRPARVPMPAVTDAAPTAAGERVLLVLLPGMGDRPTDLIRRGMVEMVRERGIAADVVVADAHFGYYRSRQTPTRLWQDIVEPARAAGYEHVWLAGISLGGFGALLYGASHTPEVAATVDGVFAIAPYLGDGDIADEIRAAGGLTAWRAGHDADDYTRALFTWLRGYGDPDAPRPALFLGVGADDAFARSARLIAPLLPDGNFIEVPGEHSWRPWLRIWGEMLDRAPLPRIATAAAAQP